ncbi:phage tail protein [Acinetobacter baumannii]|uniref:phage tail fiber protein n=1 Tax=Acinetobacter baumannii TaxID=470 RepID=UPI0038B43500
MANLVFKFSWDHRPFPYNASQGKRQFMLPFASGIPNLNPNFSQVQGTAAISQGGTGATTAAEARNNLGAAEKGVNTDITEMKGLATPLSVAQGGTGASSAADARTNLGLGNAAQGTLTTSTFDSILGRILKVGDFGLGSSPITQAGLTLDQLSGASHFGFGDRLFSGYGHGYIMIGGARPAILGLYNGEFCYKTKKDAEAYSPTYTVKSTKNTTIDANGFLKSASPVVKLFKDHIELNSDAEKQPIEFKKVDVGDYLLKGSLGFAQEGWYIEVPKDANGNTIVAVVYDTLENGDLSIKTYKRKFDFELAAVVADLEIPTDIPEGRWIDIRLHEEPEPEPEPPTTETPFDFQPTNLSQAVAAAMNGVEPPEISDTDETL